MLFESKKIQVQNELERYRNTVLDCVARFCQTVRDQALTDDAPTLEENIADVSRLEGEADTIRREIQVMLYSKSLFPESRGDILGLLEATDSIANRAETTAFMIRNQRVPLPESLHQDIFQLCDLVQQSVKSVLKAQELLFSNFTSTIEHIGIVNELESQADRIEHRLISEIFSSSLADLEKIVFRDFVHKLASISDQAENVGDRLRIIVAKRGI